MKDSGNEVIKTIIRVEKITQRELANKLNVSEQLVSKWVNYENTPTIKSLLTLVLEFRSINPYWILTGEGDYENTEWKQSSYQCNYCLEKDRTISILQDHIGTLKEQNMLLKGDVGIKSKVG